MVELISPKTNDGLAQQVQQIIRFWGEDEGVELERVVEVASNLYGAQPSEVMEALIENLRSGSIGARFVANSE